MDNPNDSAGERRASARMRTFTEYYDLREAAVPYRYHELTDGAEAHFDIDNISFQVGFGYRNDPQVEWPIEIYDVDFEQVDPWQPDEPLESKKLNAMQLMQFFDTLDAVMIEFVDRKENEGIWVVFAVHPLHVQSDKEGFDPKRHTMYQTVFQKSRLLQLGYEIDVMGEYIYLLPKELMKEPVPV